MTTYKISHIFLIQGVMVCYKVIKLDMRGSLVFSNPVTYIITYSYNRKNYQIKMIEKATGKNWNIVKQSVVKSSNCLRAKNCLVRLFITHSSKVLWRMLSSKCFTAMPLPCKIVIMKHGKQWVILKKLGAIQGFPLMKILFPLMKLIFFLILRKKACTACESCSCT